jgi:LPS-assembly protein
LEPRSSSPVVSVLRMSPITGLGVEWRADYDHRRGEIVDTLLSLDYRRSKYYGSIGEYQVHTDPILTAPANQIVFRGGFGEPNHRGWNAGVTGIYDYHAKPHVLRNAIAQVTYNTDCCGLSFQYGRFSFGTRNENQFRVAFAVANIGTFGNLRRQEIYTR